MAALFYSKGDFQSMFLMLLVSVLVVYGYFKYGTVYAACRQMKKDNIKKAEKLIATIKHPERLGKGHKSYYYFTSGIIALEYKDLEKSHSELTRALEIGLRTENDTSIVLLNLANIELMRKNFSKAKDYIIEVRKLTLKPLVALETDRIEGEINTAQQAI